MGNELIGMKQMWLDRNLPGEVVGITPNFMRHYGTTLCRGKEIDAYLKEHPEIENFVIIDDDSDMLEEQMGNFHHSDPWFGMSPNHLYRIQWHFEGKRKRIKT